MIKNKLKKYIKEGLMLTSGAASYAVAVGVFLGPLKISPGGLAGVAAALNYLTSAPTGLLIIIFNVPLIALGLFKLGSSFMLKTAVTVLISSTFIDVISELNISLFSDKVVCSAFGGFLMGLGLGLVMLIGASTGGVDIAVKLINRRFNISIGRAFLLIDGLVIIFASIIYTDFQSALYSVITILVSSKTLDLILYGNSDSRVFFIITSKKEILSEELINSAGRGVTILNAQGGYTGKDSHMLLCVARNNEINKVRNTIKYADKEAFFFIVNAGDVIGKGFQ